jgi:hypothetical protein
MSAFVASRQTYCTLADGRVVDQVTLSDYAGHAVASIAYRALMRALVAMSQS